MAYVLAGGRGSRLLELTDKRVRPAVYFGAKSRIIDFALSNALNSGIRHIAVATQYKAHSLIRHLQGGWNFFRPERNESFDILPASQRVSETMWYEGTADAVYQNIDIIESYAPEFIVILAGDHIYKMDYEVMLQQHVSQGADVTVGCIEVPRMEASGFGVMAVDAQDRIISFLEKPKDPPGMPDKPEMALASMGIYVFSTRFLLDQLRRDAAEPGSKPGLRQRHHPVPGGARQSRRPSLYTLMRSLLQRGASLLAGCRYPGCILGGQHRSDPSHAGLGSLRHGLADLDLCRDHATGETDPGCDWARGGNRLRPLRRLHRIRSRSAALDLVYRSSCPLHRLSGGSGGAARSVHGTVNLTS
jgi:NDP-sugar pyrophosphorylase family protein